MTIVTFPNHASFDPFPKLVDSLIADYGRGGAVIEAERLIAAEYADFHWDSRIAEMNLGAHDDVDEDAELFERVAIIGYLRGRYFAATCAVDGERRVDRVILLRHADTFDAAVALFNAFAA